MGDRAEVAARILAWAHTIQLLPGWELRESRTDSRLGNIIWVHPEYQREFLLMKVRWQPNKESIRVLEDNRHYVDKILQNPDGLRREMRLFKAVNMLSLSTPPWFIKAEQVSSSLDKRGVDGIASVRFTRQWVARLPFQIKSSLEGEFEFYEHWPQYRGVVPVIRINDHIGNDLVRTRFYSGLGETRNTLLDAGHNAESLSGLLVELFGKYARDFIAAP